MSQEIHHEGHHGQDTRLPGSFRASFWFVIILVGLFIAAVNFVNVMSNDNGEGNKITDTPKPVEAPMEATSSQTLAGENGNGKVIDTTKKTTPGTTPAADTTGKPAQH